MSIGQQPRRTVRYAPRGSRRPVAYRRDRRLPLSLTGWSDEEILDPTTYGQKRQPLDVAKFLSFCSSAASSRLLLVQEPRDPGVLDSLEESASSQFQPINSNREPGLCAEERTTLTRPLKRQKTNQGAAGELGH